MNIRVMITFLAGLILTIMPLPDMLVQFRPPWILLILLYMQFYLPHYFNVTLIFILGLMLDSLLATVIGEHALILCVVAWLATSKTRRFALFSIGQQMIFIAFFAMVYQIGIALIDSFLGYRATLESILGAGLVSVLVWPWLSWMGGKWLLESYSQAKRA